MQGGGLDQSGNMFQFHNNSTSRHHHSTSKEEDDNKEEFSLDRVHCLNIQKIDINRFPKKDE